MKATLVPLFLMELKNLHMPKLNLARDSYRYLTNLHPDVRNLPQKVQERLKCTLP